MSASPLLSVALICLAWPAQFLGAGYIAHRLPRRLFFAAPPRGGVPPQGRQTGGDHLRCRVRLWLYHRVLHIRRWKDLLPEAGALFPGGFAKGSLASGEADYLRVFAAETRRAEFSHWLTIALTVHFFLWLELPIAMVMPPLALVGNLPFILTQRYNRLRLLRTAQSAERTRSEAG